MRLEQIPLDELCPFPYHHVKQQNIDKDLDDLIISIKALGLLSPIIVYDTKSDNVSKDITDGRYDIIDGQRRVHALLELNKLNPDQGFDKAECVIHEKLDEMQKRAISFACNAFSAKPSKADLSDTMTRLYGDSLDYYICQKQFGVPSRMIRKYVGLARVPIELREMVENRECSIDVALKAVDALGWEPGNDVEGVIALTKELVKMRREKELEHDMNKRFWRYNTGRECPNCGNESENTIDQILEDREWLCVKCVKKWHYQRYTIR